MQGVQALKRISPALRVRVVRSTATMVLTPEQKRRMAHLPLKPVEFNQ